MLGTDAVDRPARKVEAAGQRALNPAAVRAPEAKAASISDGRKIAGFIFEARQVNERDDEFVKIEKYLSHWADPNLDMRLALTYLYLAGRLFKEKVGDKKDWDYKYPILKQWGETSQLFGCLIRYDMWGNLHYGWIGKRLGFSSSILLDIAGHYQKDIKPEWRAAYEAGPLLRRRNLDDPMDQAAIELGIELNDSAKPKNLEEFLQFLRRNLSRIVVIPSSGWSGGRAVTD